MIGGDGGGGSSGWMAMAYNSHNVYLTIRFMWCTVWGKWRAHYYYYYYSTFALPYVYENFCVYERELFCILNKKWFILSNEYIYSLLSVYLYFVINTKWSMKKHQRRACNRCDTKFISYNSSNRCLFQVLSL